MKKNAYTTVPERFMKPYELPAEKIDCAIEAALAKLEQNLPRWELGFVANDVNHRKYREIRNCNWEHGMNTGIYWLAYELSGNEKFRQVAERMLPSYRTRLEEKIGMDDHDVGFAFSPSCVAAYRMFGDEEIKKLLLETVDYYYNTGYSQKGGFVLRYWPGQDTEGGCRTMMDTEMNAPFLFWAGQETGKQEYTDAAISQNKITAEYLIRDDGSSYHHYQFEPGTHKPVRGVTWQGRADESCWSRGHAWGVYGFPIAYAYTKDPYFADIHKDVTYYLLNKLPEDLIPYWDFDFTSGDEPRDSSVNAISICGMLEMIKYLPDDAPEKAIYQSAAAQMMEALIDKCTGTDCYEHDGLICHVTGGVPQNECIDSITVYGDYFYLEALMRYKNPDWKMYW